MTPSTIDRMKYTIGTGTRISRAAALVFCVALPVLLRTPFALAQSVDPGEEKGLKGSSPRIEVTHTPLASSEIPPVGSLMKVRLSLLNTLDIETKIRLVGSKDGRFIDIAFPTGALNDADQPTFVAEIPSPVAAFTYQFIVHQKDGSLTSSSKFVMRRTCIQNFSVNAPETGSTAQFRRQIASLIAQANSLERDNKSLEASLKLLEEMKSSMSR